MFESAILSAKYSYIITNFNLMSSQNILVNKIKVIAHKIHKGIPMVQLKPKKEKPFWKDLKETDEVKLV